MVIETTTRRKTIIKGDKVVSDVEVDIAPTLIRYAGPTESPSPVEDQWMEERRQIGAWDRLVNAVKRYGFGGI